ncbi:acyclic terpene utilization AtuA family protein [Frankia sp. CcI49]|uniref:acyclic terpene utilization AtuA family protein n=1 Tax=Frankia sp. CcI49 TaxID=1745382 RepID=UPI001F528E73|nr:acyclic terpene utilization AtuA family protein [Frankia sp. CcI49]
MIFLGERMAAVLEPCVRRGVRVVTNMGAANPLAAARVIVETARGRGLRGLVVAAVTGDDVLDAVRAADPPLLERESTVASLGDAVVSANAYLGCEPVVRALERGADVVVTGRVADPSLYLAPLVHEFGWSAKDWDLLARGTAAGHLLECAGQVTGGYFADPGVKDVPDLARLGFPIAQVTSDGSFTVTKVAGSGGRVTVRTMTEQLLYEVHDPAAYRTPDVVADLSQARLEQVGDDEVAVFGIVGRERPDSLKVSVAYRDGYVGTGEISYAGPGAVARGRLALEVVKERLALIGIPATEICFQLIGVDAVHRGAGHLPPAEPVEVRARVAGRTASLVDARRIGREVTALWLNGPAGGGGATRDARELIGLASVFLPRDQVSPDVTLLES